MFQALPLVYQDATQRNAETTPGQERFPDHLQAQRVFNILSFIPDFSGTRQVPPGQKWTFSRCRFLSHPDAQKLAPAFGVAFRHQHFVLMFVCFLALMDLNIADILW